MRKEYSLLAKWVHLLMAVVTFLLILFYMDGNSTLQATAFLVWGTIVLIDQMWIYYCKTGYNVEVILIFAAAYLLLLFLIWLGNTVLKTSNGLFIVFGWEFRIGNIFPAPLNFAFSFPALICAAALSMITFYWDEFVHYKFFRFMTIYFPEFLFKKRVDAHEKAI